jgi:hypothetical protein
MPAISIITATRSRTPPQPTDLLSRWGADYLPAQKTRPGLVCDRILYRHESPLSLTPEPTNQSNQGKESTNISLNEETRWYSTTYAW